MKQKLTYYLFNIKLQSKATGDTRIKEYLRIITKLSESNQILKLGKSEGMTMYSAFGYNGNDIPDYVWGHAAKGIYIEGNEVSVIEKGALVREANTPKIIEPSTVNFIFVSKKHRLAVEKKAGGPTEMQFLEYLTKYLEKYVKEEDILEIILEKDESIIEEIFKARAVYKLSYKISYTNDDTVGILGSELEKQIRDSKIGKLNVTAISDNKAEGMEVKDSMLLEGGLELAEANGEITSAEIKPAGSDKIKRVTNTDKPKNISITIESNDNKWIQWFKNIINLV